MLTRKMYLTAEQLSLVNYKLFFSQSYLNIYHKTHKPRLRFCSKKNIEQNLKIGTIKCPRLTLKCKKKGEIEVKGLIF